MVYSRYNIPAVSLDTLRGLLIQQLPPLVYAYRGGFKVKLNGKLLRQKRLEANMSLSDLAQAVGVSKRTIYEYERDAIDVSLETALRIEEFFDEPFTQAINLFDEMKQIGSITKPSSRLNKPKNELEKRVKEHFNSLGYKDQLWTRKIPFRLLAKAPEKETKRSDTVITGISRKYNEKEVVKKIRITYSISRITETNPLIVLGENAELKTIQGVPIISINELKDSPKKDLQKAN
ncbi:MAG: helix-turn-helix domain-containing protein [Asgard group archaeon]|nr:helix-turn-helix domain-containing protein [Asgard group archaeon]